MVMQVYKDDGSSTMFITDSPLFNKEPKIIRNTEYENWCIDQIVREYLASGDVFKPLLPHQIAEYFPQGKTYLNQRKKDINVQLGELLEEDRKINIEFGNFKDKEKREGLLAVNESKRQRLVAEKDSNQTILGFLNPKKRTAIQNFQVELARAKTYPIEKLLPFNRQKKTACLWHNDNDPSLYLYKKDNRVHCFVCENGGDSVDVVRQQKGCSIGEAIKFLNQA